MAQFSQLIPERLSRERFGPYRRATSSDSHALALYEWNTAVSAAIWSDLAHLEVLLRNVIHDALTKWSTNAFHEPRWYTDPAQILTSRHLADIREARRRATTGRRAKPETLGRVVAELNFGFWRYLLASHYERTLWVPVLRHAFPRLMGRGTARDLHRDLARLHALRNRVAHHEPIYREPLQQLQKNIVRILDIIDPTYCEWVEQNSTVTTVLAQRP